MSPVIDVIVLGHVVSEKIIFPDRTLDSVIGGPASYSSLCLQKLGTRVGLVTHIGTDFPKKALEAGNLDTTGIHLGQNSTQTQLDYDANGKKRLSYREKASPITFTDIPDTFLQAPIAYFCPMNYEVDLSVISELSKKNITIVVDLGGYGGATSEPNDEKEKTIQRICSLADVIKASQEDYEHIFEQPLSEKEISEKIRSWGAKTSIVTLSARGVFLSNETDETYIPASVESDRVIDETGGGDTFGAGFVHALLAGASMAEAARYGNNVAAYVIQRTGGATVERMPSATDLN